jgi:hypothetical protein
MSDFVKSISAAGAVLTNGLTVVTGGTGIAGLTIAAPSPGERAVIRIGSISSGSVVLTAASGITLDGTNNVATFNAAEDVLVLVYNSATAWAVEENVSVSLSTS